VRAVKIRAANENRRLKDVVADLLRHGLVEHPRSALRPRRKRVVLPLIKCAHEARKSEELIPDRVTELLAQEESARLTRSA
jgi:hypothetical protein